MCLIQTSVFSGDTVPGKLRVVEMKLVPHTTTRDAVLNRVFTAVGTTVYRVTTSQSVANPNVLKSSQQVKTPVYRISSFNI